MTRKELNLAKLEDTLVELEQLVARLEEGELPLDKALREFERGIQMTRQCQKVLKDAEQKIEILLADSDDPVPFEQNT
jgi:exodeoxyribonuclease VII small subunit